MADERRTQTVSLGCGTLILIVLIFGRDDTSDLKIAIVSVQGDVRDLRETIKDQTAEIRLLRQQLQEVDEAEAVE